MTDVQGRVLGTIRKLLAKAHDGAIAGTAEAEAFAAKAQELMLEHRIAMTDIEFAELQASDPIKEWYVDPKDIGIRERRQRVYWSTMLADIVARGFNCRVYTYSGSNAFTIIGRQADAEIVAFMYHFLYTFVERESRRQWGVLYRQAHKLGRTRELSGWKESFRNGFLVALKTRFDAQRGAAQRSMEQRGVALVRISDADVQAYEDNLKLSNTRLQPWRSNVNSEGYARGIEAGSNVDISARVVGDGRATRRKELR